MWRGVNVYLNLIVVLSLQRWYMHYNCNVTCKFQTRYSFRNGQKKEDQHRSHLQQQLPPQLLTAKALHQAKLLDPLAGVIQTAHSVTPWRLMS